MAREALDVADVVARRRARAEGRAAADSIFPILDTPLPPQAAAPKTASGTISTASNSRPRCRDLMKRSPTCVVTFRDV